MNETQHSLPVRKRLRLPRLVGVAVLTGAILTAPGMAYAADDLPPLPQNAISAQIRFAPATDYDNDGCYAGAAIGSNGVINPGLSPTGALNGGCRNNSQLQKSNAYTRIKCNNGYCGIVYAYYFPKDQNVAGPAGSVAGHRHDWEHAVVWIKAKGLGFTIEAVAATKHNSCVVQPASAVRFQDSHAKIVYNKDDTTHFFRFANSGDEPPENFTRNWYFPPVVDWETGFPPGLRDKLANADFGKAQLALRDSDFAGKLNQCKPAGIAFNPFA